MEFNKLAAAVLVAGLIFMAINVGVDEILRVKPLDKAVFPVPETSATVADTVAEDTALSVMALLGSTDTDALDRRRAYRLRVMAPLSSTDIDAGRKRIKRCVSCHDFTQGGPSKIGPNLWGIVGAPMASREGFSYSSALSAMGGTWSYEALDAFLTKPRKFVPGTKMSFAGLKRPKARANIIGFLRMLSENPMPLPDE